MKRNITIFSLALLVFLVSCEKEPRARVDIPSGTDVIDFATSLPEDWEPLSKAVNVDLTYLKNNGFGVYAYYTGTKNYTGASSVAGVVLEDRKVWYGADYTFDNSQSGADKWVSAGSNSWIYYGREYPGFNPGNQSTWKYKEYWPMRQSEKTTFFAYAPWSIWNSSNGTAGNGYRVTAASKGAVPTINYQLFTNGQGGASQSGSTYTVTVANSTFADAIQKDLLWGVQSTGYPYKDFQRPASNTAEHQKNTVDFKFRHALSKLSFSIAAEVLPTENPTDISNFDSYYVESYSSGWGGGTTSVPRKTVYLVESVEVSSDDGLLTNSATLSLDNTTDANTPEWSGKAGTVKYNFSYTSTNPTFGSNINYFKNASSNTFNASNNRTNFSTLISNRTSTTGITTEPQTLMGSTGNRLYVIPNSGQLTVRVKYHKVTFYYHRDYSNQWWTVYEPSSGAGTTVTKTISANIEAGRSYNINLLLKGNGTDVDLEFEVQPWEVFNRTYSYSEDDYQVIDWLTFDSEWIDYRVDNLVYINNRVGKFTFRVKGGKYVRWMAELRPSPEGNGTDGFHFTDKNGVPLTYPDGTELDELYGELGENVYNEIYVQARNLEAPKINAATLRFTFDNNATPLEAVVPLNLINQYYNGTTKRIQEWTVVQNAN